MSHSTNPVTHIYQNITNLMLFIYLIHLLDLCEHYYWEKVNINMDLNDCDLSNIVTVNK